MTTTWGASSANSVNAIATNAANIAAIPTGDTSFTFTGPGFGDVGGTQNGVTIKVNMSGVDDTAAWCRPSTLPFNPPTPLPAPATVPSRRANVTASIHTDSAGKEQLSFNSSNTAFQVTADDLMSNALIGNFNGSPQGNIAGSTGSSLIAGGAYMLATKASPNTENDLGFVPITAASGETQAITLSANDASGAAHTLTVTLNDSTTGDSITDALNTINNALQNSDDSTLKQITAVQNPAARR